MSFANMIKARTPWPIRRAIRGFKRRIRWMRNSRRPVGEVFQEVYQRAMWGGEEGDFYSGPGSDSDAAAYYAAGIAGLIAERGIRSVVDLGCGDFRVAKQFLGGSDVAYKGVDVVEILQVLPKLKQYRYVVYSDYQPGPSASCVPNRDISHGIDTRIWKGSALFLDKPPFNVPMKLLFESLSPIVLCDPGECIALTCYGPDVGVALQSRLHRDLLRSIVLDVTYTCQ